MDAEEAVTHRSALTDIASVATHATISIVGLVAFLHPFWTAQVGSATEHTQDAPLMTAALIALSLIAMLIDAQQAALDVRQIALLGVLTAMNSALRFAEVALPGPGGFTPIFFLIICGGFVFGARFGFLLGALTLLVSAVVTGGVGPWLPFQMFTAGWMGLSAGWLGLFSKTHAPMLTRRSHFVLIIFGAVCGFAYGAVMNLWSWPYTVAAEAGVAAAHLGAFETLRRYAAYYALTSFAWDLFGAAGNALLLALFAPAVVRTMRRFRMRFVFVWRLETP